MRIGDKIKGLFSVGRAQEEITLLSPLDGRVVPLEAVADETFATKILGDGIAILPTGDRLCAPVAARVAQTVGQKEDPSNFLLMHAMGPNVAGVIGSAVAAGVLLACFA